LYKPTTQSGHYLTPSPSTLTFLLPPLHTLFLKHKILPLSQQTSASLPSRLGLWLLGFWGVFCLFVFSVQNASANPGSTSITFTKPSMIPSARCNHTTSIIPEDFYLCFSSRTHTHHFLSYNTVFSQITKNPYLVHPIISLVPYKNPNHSQQSQQSLVKLK